MQSPSFHVCESIYEDYDQTNPFIQKLYLSYGTGDDTENQDKPFVEILENQGYPLKLEVIPNGDHEWKVWKPQLGRILVYLYGRQRPVK